MKTIIIVLLDRFADWEPAFISSALTSEVARDVKVVYASNTKDAITSIGGMRVLMDISLDEVPMSADGIIFIGADGSWRKPQAQAEKLAKRFKKEGKLVAAICDAARWLGSIGLLNDVRHTANFKQELLEHEGYTNKDNYLDEEAVRDGKTVTANGNAPVRFAGEVLRALEIASEEKIQEYVDFYTLGFQKALKKYGYV